MRWKKSKYTMQLIAYVYIIFQINLERLPRYVTSFTRDEQLTIFIHFIFIRKDIHVCTYVRIYRSLKPKSARLIVSTVVSVEFERYAWVDTYIAYIP